MGALRALQEFVGEVQAQRESVLAGETYVQVPEEQDGAFELPFVERHVLPRARPHH